MERKQRPEIPKDKIIPVNNSIPIDFSKPFKFIYFDKWFYVVTFPAALTVLGLSGIIAKMFGLEVEGKENLELLKKDKKGYIVISNHCHYMDTVFANVLVFPRIMHTSVAQKNFEIPIIRRILRILRCFPIPKKNNGLERIKEVTKEALDRGHHILFLPEGELVVMSQTIYRFHLGAFILSYWHQRPIIPMVYILWPRKKYANIMHKIIDKDWWIKMKVVYGKPIYPPKPTPDGSIPMEEIRDMAEIAASWMEEEIAKHHANDDQLDL